MSRSSLFSPVVLTNAGRPIFLDEDEVEIQSYSHIEIFGLEEKLSKLFTTSQLQSLQLLLTNVRLILITHSTDIRQMVAWGMYLQLIVSCVDKSGSSFFSRSKRAILNLRYAPATTTATPAANPAGPTPTPAIPPPTATTTSYTLEKSIEIKFHDGQKEEFLEQLQRALDRKSWEYIFAKIQKATRITTPPPPTTTSNNHTAAQPGFSVKNAGIGGIIRRAEQTVENMDTLTATALTDLNHLMEKAREVTATVQRYAILLQESRATKTGEAEEDENNKSEEMSETTTQVAERYELENLMQEIGIISPVSKLSSGRSYHLQLAREICDLLLTKQRLQRLGGMISLTDLYCLLNRIHGTELISPLDVSKATECIESLRLGIQLRVFPQSQVKVLYLTSNTTSSSNSNSSNRGDPDLAMSQRILEYLSDPTVKAVGVTVSEVVQQLNLSFLIVKELFQLLERKEQICRDDSVEGIRYFVNEFPRFVQKYCNG